MAKFTLNVEMDNAAFDNREWELSRILKELADQTIRGDFNESYDGKVRDINGNVVGIVKVEE